MGGDVNAPAHATIGRLGSRHRAPLLLITLLNGHHSLQCEVNRPDFDPHPARLLILPTSSDALDPGRATRHLRHVYKEPPQRFPCDWDGATVLKVHAEPSLARI